MKRTLYKLVTDILIANKQTRNCDKKLCWETFTYLGIVRKLSSNKQQFIFEEDFLKAPSTESIRRCRQKIQELEKKKVRSGKLDYEDSLLADKQIQALRNAKEETKGTFVFSETY